MSERRVPPQNVEAERSVLGAIMLRNEALNGLDWLEAEDFYDPRHREVFAAMRALAERSRPIDAVTLEEQLGREGKIAAVGGIAFLSELLTTVATSDNVGHYAEIVRDKAVARRMIAVASEIAARGFGDYGEVHQYLDDTERMIFEITQRRVRGGAQPVGELLKQLFKTFDARFSSNGVTGVATGFERIDEMTAGLQPSDLVILAARPSMGKTAFALSVAQNAALQFGHPVMIFSLEMSAQQLAERMLCSEARIDSSALRRGQLQRQDMTNLTIAADAIDKAPIMIDDTPALTVNEVRARCRQWRSGPAFGAARMGLVVVDYLQLMRGQAANKNANREQEISEISRGLKALAKEIQCPVLALSQLSRKCDERTDKRPLLSDLRECVTGDTLVHLADGRRVPIADLVGTTPRVLAVDDRGRLLEADSDKVWRVGRRPVIEVHLASGRRIRATGRHRLLGPDGWRRVDQLAPGDRLAIARELPAPAEPVVWPDLRVALLGQLVGDGSYLAGQPMRYTTASEANGRIVEEAARTEFGARVTRIRGRGRWHQLLISGNGNRWRPAGVNAWLRELGIFGQRSHEKRLPREAFRLGNDQVALLLRHLWATDGTISPRLRGRGAHGVHFSTCSRGLAGDVAALLLRLGIVARTYRIAQAAHRPVFMVAVSGAAAQRRFLARVGAFGDREAAAERLSVALAETSVETNVDTIPRGVMLRVKRAMAARGISQRRMAAIHGTSYGGSSHFRFAPSRTLLSQYAGILVDEGLQAVATSDLFWDRIVSIEPAGEEDVYDLTVPGPASWLADGIVSHNSGAIEQDADVIMFIYREEAYLKDKTPEDKKGIAEVIIGKQRNGPIGEVPMAFIGRWTRFENLADRRD